MLGHLREWLDTHQIAYEYLDGRTTNRQARVERFNQGAMPLFLISLKAGGTGLNLTGADYVIHYDPWWNPAVEDQATDRAHRIGQTRQVFNYKLLCRNTIEEKLLQLQERKRTLVKDLLEADTIGKTLTLQDLKFLFGEAAEGSLRVDASRHGPPVPGYAPLQLRFSCNLNYKVVDCNHVQARQDPA
jgi:non-specific serine/threonine protein kinase